MKIDFEYLVELLRGIVETLDEDVNDEKVQDMIRTIREMINEFAGDNEKLAELLRQVVDDIEKDKKKYSGQDISDVINQMRYAAIDKAVRAFADKWFLNFDDVRYEALNFRDGELANENKLKDGVDYAAYKSATPDGLPKFKFRKAMIDEFKEVLMPEILPFVVK